jgi:hypothetical protein
MTAETCHKSAWLDLIALACEGQRKGLSMLLLLFPVAAVNIELVLYFYTML